MEIDFRVYRIELKHTFGISRSSNDWYDVILIYIIDESIIGRGEAAPSIRYNESPEKIISVLNKDIKLPEDCSDRSSIWNYIYPQLGGIKALEAGFSMALWDWWGKKIGKPIFKLLNAKVNKMPLTSYTIAIGDLDDIGPKVQEAEPYSILKVKLGTPDMDKNIINEVRNHTDKLIRVDANEGWDSENALELCKWLADRNIEFIEQPFCVNELSATAELKKKSPLPLYADENSMCSDDIRHIKYAFDGINIKLMKCGSLEEGKKMIDIAKSYGLKVMLGCMVETSIGITSISHFSGETDVADLDGNLLINNDPYLGTTINNGHIVLPDANGSGIKLKNNDLGLL